LEAGERVNRTGASVAGAAACLAALAGCATFSDTIRSTERNLAQQQPRLALAEYEKRQPGSADQALYLMNRGMLLRMAGEYEQSTRALEEAKNIIDNLRAVSLREQVLSIAINDSAQSFIGEDFEQVMVHAFLALNYLEQGRLDAARVEALQADVLLRQIAPGALVRPYAEDAFTRYLTGIVYEDEGEWSDAMIAYRKAYEAYRGQLDRFGVAPPETLKHDLIRLADRMGLTQEAEGYRESFGIRDTLSAAALLDRGEIILTVHAGLAPAKREHAITVVNPNTGHLLRLALPQYHSRGHPFAYARVSVESQSAISSRVANIDAIAIKSLEARMPAITARALARMIAKDAVARAAASGDRGSGGQPLAGLAVNIAAVLAERADTRSWFTLPGEIHLARLSLPPGRYRGRIELHGHGGAVLQSSEFQVELGKGEKRYLSRHWIPTNLEVRP
jgi:hypothetical protein